MLRSSQIEGTTNKPEITTKSVIRFNSTTSKFEYAFGNKEVKLSPSKIIYSMQQSYVTTYFTKKNCS